LVVAVFVGWSHSPSDACSLPAHPLAYVIQPASGKAPGVRPWIVTGNLDPTKLRITQITTSCGTDKVCSGTDVPFDHDGRHVRPTANLPAGARIQITLGAKLLTDTKLTDDTTPAKLPAWNGVALASAGMAPEGLCSPAGPAVTVTIKPTKANLDAAVLLVYLEAPDPKQPLRNLSRLYTLGGGDSDLTFRNALSKDGKWLAKVPAKIWVALADAHGNVEAAREIAIPSQP
jgi:hypothetical protein